MSVADDIGALFDRRGAGEYFGEKVSMSEHALQAAYFGGAAGASSSLIVAALLHDIGHLIGGAPSDIKDWTSDAHHEAIGSRWLAARFPPEVSEPVRLHVSAKRYLLATDDEYFAKLSPASVITLKLQGGPMAADEIAKFETEPFYQQAILVRRWDDLGKVAGLATPAFADYRASIERLEKISTASRR